VKTCGLLVLFDGAECRAYPLLDDMGAGLDLAERLSAFCKAILTDPDIASCVAGLHEHVAGTCARRADGSGS
jgi:hypothetical protein